MVEQFVAAAAVGAGVGFFVNVSIDRLSPEGAARGDAPPCSAHAREPWRRALVVLLLAAMFALGWWYYGGGVLLASRLVFGCALVALAAIDLEYRLLPNLITLPGIVIGFAFSLFGPPGWGSSLGGILIGGGLPLLVTEVYQRLRRENRLGTGDAKMLAMIGAFVGWPLMLVGLVLALVSGSFVSVAIAARLHRLPPTMPFGPFLAVGAALAATVGPAWLEWYIALW